MISGRYLLLTGATGFLGQYLLRDLLHDNVSVAVVARSRQGDSAELRIERLIRQWEDHSERALNRPICLDGDMNESHLGLDSADLDWVCRHCDTVLHNAASLEFHGVASTGEPWRTNVTGTRHLLDLCRRADISRFHHVSTAYACGKREDPVHEGETECNHSFRNDYECSKAAAERLVREADFLDAPTVFRPAVIVGDSRTGYTASYHGPYQYAYFTSLMRKQADHDANGRWHLPIRINMTGDERRNLVPVDWVSAVITHIVRHSDHHGDIYHLTPCIPVTSRLFEEALATYFQYDGVRFVGPKSLPDSASTDAERMFYQFVALYQDYQQNEPFFDSTNTQKAVPHLPCPALNLKDLHRLVDFGVRDRWGKRTQRSRAVFDAHS